MNIQQFDTAQKVFVIAEIGNNHEGDLELAKKMIGLAADCGVHAVKFQTIVPERLIASQNKDRIAQLTRFRFSYEQFSALANTARNEGLLFLSTPFDLESAEFLNTLVPAFKIASCDNNFYPLLDYVACTGKPILFSTGLADLDQIQKTKTVIEKSWAARGIKSEMAALHCVSNYPTAPEDANLKAIKKLHELGVTVGYSDHTLGIDACVLAVALGARIIEKHFTVDKNYSSFRDHQMSADPADLKSLMAKIALAETMLGHGDVRHPDNGKLSADVLRRSIAAGRDLPKGTVLSFDDLSWVRPGGGIAPGEEAKVIGKALMRDIAKGEILSFSDLAGKA